MCSDFGPGVLNGKGTVLGDRLSSLMGHPADIKLESQITNLLEKGESESRSVESDFL